MATRQTNRAHFSRECPQPADGGDRKGINVCINSSNEPGHFSRECSQAGDGGDDSDSSVCSNFNGQDHSAHHCPHLGGGGGQGGSRTGTNSDNVFSNEPGRFSRECPQTADDDESGAVQLPGHFSQNAGAGAQVQSAAASPSKKVLARRRRHYNKKNRLTITVSSHARVPEKIKVNCRSKRYDVEAIIATYVHTNKETAYFVQWLGYRGTDASSWVLSVDTDCTETLVAFVNEANVDQIFSALLGQPVTETTRQLMTNNLKFHDVCARFNIPNTFKICETNISFSDASQTEREDAINKLPDFIRDCMTP